MQVPDKNSENLCVDSEGVLLLLKYLFKIMFLLQVISKYKISNITQKSIYYIEQDPLSYA